MTGARQMQEMLDIDVEPVLEVAPGGLVGPCALEDDDFPFEAISDIAEVESWRKEINRPVYHIHKWWAQRLGSVFRAIVLGALAPSGTDIMKNFHKPVRVNDATVFDPFMGSGTTIGEAAKLGARAIGRDINPVAHFLVRNALAHHDRASVLRTFGEIERDVAGIMRSHYKTILPDGTRADVLYYFWVKQVECPECETLVDLFSSRIFAKHAYPRKHPQAKALCPHCGAVNSMRYDAERARCSSCDAGFDPRRGPAKGQHATCPGCDHGFSIAKTVRQQGAPPKHRLYAKLVLTPAGRKEYVAATDVDLEAYGRAERELERRSRALSSGAGPLDDCPSGAFPADGRAEKELERRSHALSSGAGPLDDCPSGAFPADGRAERELERRSRALSSGACPLDDCPSGAFPADGRAERELERRSRAFSSGAVPSGAVPSDDCPSGISPSNTFRSDAVPSGAFPVVEIEPGHNTNQVLGYNYRFWHEMFNARQLLCLSILAERIRKVPEPELRELFTCLFSGALEFNNMFASYKGEGTGAVRHMFAHHILKPERVPLEANVWGTPKSSGSFMTMFEGRIRRALDYADNPFELRVRGKAGERKATEKIHGLSAPLAFDVADDFQSFKKGKKVYLSCGDSSETDIEDGAVDAIITDPPFFDNVHYSQLADFFHVWQRFVLGETGVRALHTTRSPAEVQNSDASAFTERLGAVWSECYRVLSDDGVLAFTYHHSRSDGWSSVLHALMKAGFGISAAFPIKAEMSVAMPKLQAREPIDLDIVLVCRKRASLAKYKWNGDLWGTIVPKATGQVVRFREAGRKPGRNDVRIIVMAQLIRQLSRSHTLESALALLEASDQEIESTIENIHVADHKVHVAGGKTRVADGNVYVVDDKTAGGES